MSNFYEQSDRCCNVVLIEDNDAEAELAVQYLKETPDKNYSVKRAPRLETGIEHVNNWDPDIVLLDLGLPDSPPDQTVQQIEVLASKAPVVVLTGGWSPELELEAIENGAIEFLEKDTVEPRELRRRIEHGRKRYQTQRDFRLTMRALESAREGILLCDATDDNHPIVYANSVVERITGYAPRELAGKNPRILQCEDTSKQKVARIRSALQNNEPIRLDILNEKKDGTRFWNEMSINPVYDEAGNITHHIGFVRDATDRVETQAKIERQNQRLGRYKTAIDNAEDPIAIRDNEGYHRLLNPAARHLLPFADERTTELPLSQLRDEWDGSDLDDVFESLVEHDRQAIEQGQVQTHEERLPTTDGEERIFLTTRVPIQKDDAPDGVVAISRDITERIENKKRLERLSLVASETDNAVLIQDENGTVQWANEGFTKLTGFSTDYIIDENPFELFDTTDESSQKVKQQLIEGLNARQPAQGEGQIFHKQGQKIWIHVELTPVFDDSSGDLEQFVLMARDITERKEAEQRLRSVEKMNALGRLAGGIAHDFNNLLTVIMSFATFVKDELQEDDPRQDDIEQVLKAADSAQNLTSQLLTFSRRDSSEPRTANLNELTDEISEMLKGALGEQIALKVDYDPDLWPVKIDPGEYEQILMNLAINAKDAMPNGGTFRIETSNTRLQNPKGRLETGEYVKLEVSDTGHGIKPENIDKIFEPFFTTKEISEGTGLGLATCYGIIKQAGGELEVKSEPGEFTQFDIYLPRADKQAPSTSKQPSETSAQLENKTVLVVEDEIDVLKATIRILESAGHTVYSASSGRGALEILRQSSATIDVVLTDLIMPGMDGIDLATKMREQFDGIHILYMSGYNDDVIRERGDSDIVDEVLRKPIERESLIKKINDVSEKT